MTDAPPASAPAPAEPRATLSRSADGVTIRIEGRLDAAGVSTLWGPIAQAAPTASAKSLAIDATGVTYCDGSGIGLLAGAILRWKAAGGTATVTGLRDETARLVAIATDVAIDSPRTPPSFVANVGASAVALARTSVDLISFIGQMLIVVAPALMRPGLIRWRDAYSVFVKAGVNALPVVCLLTFLVGAIIAFQTIGPMAAYGATLQVSQVVGVAVVRELGPLITAIVVAGRSGSAFAAEIGTMRVTQEIDALTTFGLDPVRFLVVPRMLAAMVALPLLAAFGDLLGVAGGFPTLAANGFTLAQYMSELQIALGPMDFIQGLVKAFVFAILVGGIGCYCGLQTREGPGAVGDSTTRAVVAGIILIVVADAIMGSIFHVVGV